MGTVDEGGDKGWMGTVNKGGYKEWMGTVHEGGGGWMREGKREGWQEVGWGGRRGGEESCSSISQQAGQTDIWGGDG